MSEAIQNSIFKGWFENSGRLYEHRIRDLSLMRRLSDSIRLDVATDDAIAFILDILIDELNISNGSIMLFDETRQCLMLSGARGQHDASAPKPVLNQMLRKRSMTCMQPGQGVAGQVLESGNPILVADVRHDSRFVNRGNQSVVVGSMLCLPLKIRQRMAGVLNLSHEDCHAFDEADINSLSVVANQIAMILENNQNYAKVCIANEELEFKVQERTEHLEAANRELEHSRDTIVQSERLKALGQMASGVAHDFNNTLAGIIASTQVLLEEISDKELRNRLEAVEMAAKDGAVTVRRIQDFSRINHESGDLEPLDINAVMQDAITITSALWKDQAQRQGKTYTIDTTPGTVSTVLGNPAELREVIANIILNAIDAMQDGGRITCSSWEEGDDVCLAISDSGCGIPEATRAKVFDPFFTTKGPNNSGLGLSVVFGILRRHQGSIDVDSIEGVGTTFIIRLPASDITIPTKPCNEVVAAGSANILLIDDDDFVRDSVEMLLKRLGHQVTTAASGEEGLTLLGDSDFDLVISDLGMPGLSGWDVAAEVKSVKPTIPVALMTGWGRELEDTNLKERCVDYLLAKPFDLSKIASVIADAIRSPLLH